MISESFDTREFVEAVKDKDYLEILRLADREALEAWRRSLRREEGPGKEKMCIYESALKKFIISMRSSVRRANEKCPHSESLQSFQDEILAREESGFAEA